MNFSKLNVFNVLNSLTIQSLLVILLAVITAQYVAPAQAATACVQNKTTGEYERLGSQNSQNSQRTDLSNCNSSDVAAVINTLDTLPAPNKRTVKKLESLNSDKLAGLEASFSGMQEWSVRKDDKTIRAVLERWGAVAGWSIAWEVPRKVPVAFDATFFGSFEMAVDKLMRSLRGSDYPLVNCQYDDNKVVRILRRGEIKKCQE